MKFVFSLLTMLIVVFACWNVAGNAAPAGEKGDRVRVVGVPHCQTTCKDCAAVCETTLAYCRKQGGQHVTAAHLNALRDCIATCKLSADFMNRNSDAMKESCFLCKEICERCAASCDAFKDDPKMKECSDTCRKCAKTCEKMSG